MQMAFPSSSASRADGLPGSVSQSFGIVLHPMSYWRDESPTFISPTHKFCQQQHGSKHLFFGLCHSCCVWRLVLRQKRLLKGSHKLEEERNAIQVV